MNSEANHSEIQVEFIKKELTSCTVCVTESTESYNIDKTQTKLLGISIQLFLSKLTNTSLTNCHEDSKYICRTCFNLINEIEQAEVEYEKLKHSFRMIVSKNPLFNSLEAGDLENEEFTQKYKDVNKVETELNDGITSSFNTTIKLESMSDEDVSSKVSPETESFKSQCKTRQTVSAKAKDIGTRKQRKRRAPTATQKSPAEKHKCDICQRQFSQKGNYNRHLATHSGDMPFECSTCQRRFKRKDHLLAHKRTHTGEKPYECNFCLVKFNQKGGIIKHLRTHTGHEPYECSFCRRKFKQRPHLNSHLKTHTGERPYECNYCKRRFTEKSKLKIHIRTHTGERPYECTYCNRQFNQSGNLQSHMRTHTGERPFECVICSKRFNLKHHLRDHLNDHTGEKPFECGVCKQRFNYKHLVEKHVKVMHTQGVGGEIYSSFNVGYDAEPEVVLKVDEAPEIEFDTD